MSTLWSKGTQATDLVEEFTVGNDRVLDMRLACYDVMGSKAHIKMLESIGLLESDELQTLTEALDDILCRARTIQGQKSQEPRARTKYIWKSGSSLVTIMFVLLSSMPATRVR